MPTIRKSQPSSKVTARPAMGGTTMAPTPSSTSTIPSARNSFQCFVTMDCMSGIAGVVC